MWDPPGVTPWTPFGVFIIIPLGQMLQNSNVGYHSFADDTQLYISMSPNDISTINILWHCLEQINRMNPNFLQNKSGIIVAGNKEEGIAV